MKSPVERVYPTSDGVISTDYPPTYHEMLSFTRLIKLHFQENIYYWSTCGNFICARCYRPIIYLFGAPVYCLRYSHTTTPNSMITNACWVYHRPLGQIRPLFKCTHCTDRYLQHTENRTSQHRSEKRGIHEKWNLDLISLSTFQDATPLKKIDRITGYQSSRSVTGICYGC